MNQRNLICICCPLGCPMTVILENSQVVDVQGNSCKQGAVYGQKECTNPTRMVTSSVRVTWRCFAIGIGENRSGYS